MISGSKLLMKLTKMAMVKFLCQNSRKWWWNL